MAQRVPLAIDGPILRYVETRRQSHNGSRTAVVKELIQRGYEVNLEQLYQHYQKGEITLRNMAAELGLEYRELYALLEEKGLPF